MPGPCNNTYQIRVVALSCEYLLWHLQSSFFLYTFGAWEVFFKIFKSLLIRFSFFECHDGCCAMLGLPRKSNPSKAMA